MRPSTLVLRGACALLLCLSIACSAGLSPDDPGDAGGESETDGGTSGTSVPDPLATDTCPYDLAFDETHVYFVTAPRSGLPSVSEPGAIKRVAIVGGAVETIAERQPTAESIAVTAEHVWWTVRGDANNSGQVRRHAKAPGGDPESVASGELLPRHLTATAEHVWYTSFDLKRLPVAGGAGESFYASPDGRVDTFVLDATHAYFGENTFHPRVWSLALADKTATAMSASPFTGYETRSIAADDTFLYFASLLPGQASQSGLFRLAKAGGSAREKLLDLVQVPATIVVAGEFLYFAQGADLVKLAKGAPGTPQVVVAGANATRVRLNAGRLWWTVCGEGTIRSVALP